MAHFDLTQNYVDYAGNEIVVTLREFKSGLSSVNFDLCSNGDDDTTGGSASYFPSHEEFMTDACAPVIDPIEEELLIHQIRTAMGHNDQEGHLYLSSVLMTVQAGLTRPSWKDWLDARSCHDVECMTPFVVMRTKPAASVQVEISYARITRNLCRCCDMLKAIAQKILDRELSADTQNTWILARVDSGGFDLGCAHLAAPLKGLNDVELKTFLEEAREDPRNMMRLFAFKRINNNMLLWRSDIRRKFGSILRCYLYYNSLGRWYHHD